MSEASGDTTAGAGETEESILAENARNCGEVSVLRGGSEEDCDDIDRDRNDDSTIIVIIVKSTYKMLHHEAVSRHDALGYLFELL